MTSLIDIYARNAATYYDFRNNQRQAQWPRYGAIFIASSAAAIFFSKFSNDLYTAIIAVEALLVGFSFNLIFYLSSNGNLEIKSDFIEDRIEVKRINTLGKEIFYNIIYFNLVALFSVISSIFLLILPTFQPLGCFIGFETVCSKAFRLQGIMYPYFWGACLVASYFFMIESTLTFFRAIRRVNAFFEDRLNLLSPGN